MIEANVPSADQAASPQSPPAVASQPLAAPPGGQPPSSADSQPLAAPELHVEGGPAAPNPAPAAEGGSPASGTAPGARPLPEGEGRVRGNEREISASQHVGVSAFPNPSPNLQPATCDLQLPFPRLPGETPRAFSAFTAWFYLGQTRSLPALADTLGESLGTLKNWSSRFQWADRLHAFNSNLLQQHAADRSQLHRKHAADWAARLQSFREQEWDAAQKLLSAAQCFLEGFGDEQLSTMTLSQVSGALSISSQIGRSALAGAELPPSTDPVMSPVQQQMLAALKRLSGPSGSASASVSSIASATEDASPTH